jgi:hypothetical protein
VEDVIAEIVSLSGYESQVSALLDEEEQSAMEFFIACAPEDHPVMPGAGGFRKARWARRGQGKSGAKSQIESLSEADRNALAKIAAQIKLAKKGRYI